MPYCPRCDETFPEGPSCPRCRAALVASPEPLPAELQQGSSLPQLKVPRRYRRAFERLDGTPVAPRPMLALALALLLLAGGFLVGRMGTLMPDGPVVRPLKADPFPHDVSGSAEYVAWAPGPVREPLLVRHHLASGAISAVARFTPPFPDGSAGRERTLLVSLEDSAAVVLSEADGRSVVGAIPEGRSMPLWVDGDSAAWASADRLLVRERNGAVTVWSFEPPTPAVLDGSWSELHQTPDGAALRTADRRELHLAGPEGTSKALDLPADALLLAVGPDAKVALLELEGEGVVIWDEQGSSRIGQAGGRRAAAAAFSREGDKVAVVLAARQAPRQPLEAVAIADRSGAAALKPLRTRAAGAGCAPVPAWEGSERWVYLTPGDGWLYGVEASGARVEGIEARAVGCGITWMR